MSHRTKGSQGETASQAILDALAAMLREHGEPATVQRLGVGRHTIARVLGGMPVRRGTLALCRLGLAEPPVPVVRPAS